VVYTCNPRTEEHEFEASLGFKEDPVQKKAGRNEGRRKEEGRKLCKIV
jgi:hypothetical protein